MKTIKYLLLTLALVVGLALSAHSQQQIVLTPQWQQVGTKCYDCGSAFFMLHRSPTPTSSGLYESYVYAWSNSFDVYGNAVTTYISRPRVYGIDVYGRKIPTPIITMEYHLASPQTPSFNGWNFVFYLYSSNPSQRYILEFDYLDNY